MMRPPLLAVLTVVFFAGCGGRESTPSPAANTAVVTAFVKAWNAHDTTAIDTLMAPDAVHEDIAAGVTARTHREIADYFRQTAGAEPDLQWTVTNSAVDDSVVTLEWTWKSTYTGPDPAGKTVTKRPISGRGSSVAIVKDGKIRRFTDYYDYASFFR